MARTQLFARLRTLVRTHARTGRDAQGLALTRRAFVEQVLLGLGAASFASAAGCGDGDGPSDGADDREPGVAVIGAGMAGLLCTQLLEAAGVKVTLFEASERIGGRMHSLRGAFPDGQVAELGGEFIDSGHVTMHMLADKYGIVLDDRSAVLREGVVADLWWLDGQAVPEATIVEQFSQVAPKMLELVEQADSEDDDTVFVMLDNTSMQAWLDENLAAQPELKRVLEVAYRGEYGRECSEQSVLNLLYLIGSDDPEPFRIFGDSDERYHAHTGSLTFPEKVSAELVGEVKLAHKLVKVAGRANAYTLTFEVGSESRQVTASQVVFALPFTTLRMVDLTGVALSDDKRRMIAELNYGTNAKVMGAFEQRVWLVEHESTGSVTADLSFQQCWDTSIGQPGESGLVTCFLGGKAGEGPLADTERFYSESVVTPLEAVFPGVRAAYVPDSAVSMVWVTEPLARGSYACYAPGQWEFYGREGAPEADGTLHFCGEHTSLDFQGYMEGAAETGALVASAIIEGEGKKLPAMLHALMRVKRAVPQPALGERAHASRHGTRLGLRARALHQLIVGARRAG